MTEEQRFNDQAIMELQRARQSVADAKVVNKQLRASAERISLESIIAVFKADGDITRL